MQNRPLTFDDLQLLRGGLLGIEPGPGPDGYAIAPAPASAPPPAANVVNEVTVTATPLDPLPGDEALRGYSRIPRPQNNAYPDQAQLANQLAQEIGANWGATWIDTGQEYVRAADVGTGLLMGGLNRLGDQFGYDLKPYTDPIANAPGRFNNTIEELQTWMGLPSTELSETAAGFLAKVPLEEWGGGVLGYANSDADTFWGKAKDAALGAAVGWGGPDMGVRGGYPARSRFRLRR